MPATYDSAIDLAPAHRAAEAHGRHQAETGHPDLDWYAQYPVDEQSRRPGQASPGASA